MVVNGEYPKSDPELNFNGSGESPIGYLLIFWSSPPLKRGVQLGYLKLSDHINVCFFYALQSYPDGEKLKTKMNVFHEYIESYLHKVIVRL